LILVERGELRKAETVAMGLTSLIRYAYDKDEFINIWDEFDILRHYITIMNSRYNGKYTVDFDFDDRLMEYIIPRMILQPILENSIIHGFNDNDSGCLIVVKAKLAGSRVVFEVVDNGCGMGDTALALLNNSLENISAPAAPSASAPPTPAPPPGYAGVPPALAPPTAQGYENIALQNIRNRLYHYFGDDAHMSIRHGANGSGLETRIAMPVLRATGGQA
ncbi:MAG: hypothetical protein FWH01_16910, partial [Oscillospiraceae bacterium]|nr:hypothetical protein [Oscillospiraceae bacterium]